MPNWLSFSIREVFTAASQRQRTLASMKKHLLLCLLVLLPASSAPSQYRDKTLIAHRGASAYAPEHTLAAYQMAIDQKADYVEQDLQITKDGVLVCLHDLTLERTTNVEEVFPDRFVTEQSNGRDVKHWYVSDFTLAEMKRLDAGSWFDRKFNRARVPTFQEAIDEIRGKAGLYPETKEPEVYGRSGFDMERLVVDLLKKNKLFEWGSDPKTPVIIQSFSPASLQRLREYKSRLPHVLLIGDAKSEWLREDGMQKVLGFANGLGPAKEILPGNPTLVKRAHALGLSVTPYTFGGGDTGGFASLREQMLFFLRQLDVDALFTDNPDLFPRNQNF